MKEFFILLEQVKLFAVYLAIGVLLVKTSVMNSASLEAISRYVMRLALPLLIFTNAVHGVTRQSLYQALPVLGCAVLVYLLLFLLSLPLAKVFRLQGNRKNVYRALGMFGNIGFMGIPILTSLFAENGMIYIGVVTIIDQLLLWTLGVRLTSGTEKGRVPFNRKKLLNPAVISIILAVFFVCAGWQLPQFLNTALTSVGSSATSLALIYLGGIFACMNLGSFLRLPEFYGLVVVKMLAFPVLIYILLKSLPLNSEICTTMALLAGMPSMSSLVMMAKENGPEGDYAAGGVFLTTIFSLATLPFLCWLLHVI